MHGGGQCSDPRGSMRAGSLHPRERASTRASAPPPAPTPQPIPRRRAPRGVVFRRLALSPGSTPPAAAAGAAHPQHALVCADGWHASWLQQRLTRAPPPIDRPGTGCTVRVTVRSSDRRRGHLSQPVVDRTAAPRVFLGVRPPGQRGDDSTDPPWVVGHRRRNIDHWLRDLVARPFRVVAPSPRRRDVTGPERLPQR